MTVSSSTNAGKVTGSDFCDLFDTELRELIRSRTGIVVQEHQVKNLYSTIAAAMQRFGYSDSAAFMAVLRTADTEAPELKFLVTGITVGESYFFRDEDQIALLRDQYLPELIKKRAQTDKHLRIWSAGCSEGQELYTLAFLLRELIPDAENWRLHLLGTDINTESLAACHRGEYRDWSFRKTPAALREQYFHVEKGIYTLNEDIRQMASFNYLNLAEDKFPSLLTDTNAMDLILCRNVFIYFDQVLVEKILQKFMQCLVPGGILMLGASDLVNNSVPGMELVQTSGTFYYQRPLEEALPDVKKSASTRPSPRAVSHADQAALKTSAANKVAAAQEAKPVKKKTAHKPLLSVANPLQYLREYMANEQWQAVDEEVDRCLKCMDATAELILYKATAAANMGNLEQASQLCKQAIELDPVDKHAHFLLAVVYIELDQSDEAEIELRKALFLDAQFLEAHYQLGQLQLRFGHHDKGLKSLNNALQLAEQGDPRYNLHGAPGTNYERMAEMLRNEIQLHKSNMQGEAR